MTSVMGARTCRLPKIRNLVQLHQCSSRVLSKRTVEPLTPISSHLWSSRTRGGCCRQGAGADVVRMGHIVVSNETVSPAESSGDIGDAETGRERPALNRIRPRRCEQSEDDMQIDLSEEQEFFRASTRRFIEAETPLGVVRDLYETAMGLIVDGGARQRNSAGRPCSSPNSWAEESSLAGQLATPS